MIHKLLQFSYCKNPTNNFSYPTHKHRETLLKKHKNTTRQKVACSHSQNREKV